MFKVTILKAKDLIKSIIIVTIAVLAILFIFSITKQKQENIMDENKEDNFKNTLSCQMSKMLEKNLPVIFKNEDNQNSNEDENVVSENSYMQDIIKTQVGTIRSLEKSRDNNNTQENTIVSENENSPENTTKTEGVQEGPIQTEVVTPNPIQENFNAQYGTVKIKNQTDYQLTDEIMTPNITIDNKSILIFHTHTCESYTPSDAYQYEQTGSYRTTDQNFSVCRVGDELTNYLTKDGCQVNHDTTFHDYPSYNGSYTRSLSTVESILSNNPTDIVIDLHRDAVGARPDYAPTVKIGDDYAAQIMFVIGTDNGGLPHPNWNQNLKFAIKLQQKADELYPGLFKPIMLTKSRYNQHASKYANIMEIGSTGNTLDQCLVSMKYLSKVMEETINN